MPPVFDPDKLPKLYARLIDRYCSYLTEKLGLTDKTTIILKKKPVPHYPKTADAFLIVQPAGSELRNHYMELFIGCEFNSSKQPCESTVDSYFSPVVTLASGRNRARLYHTTSNVHKTGGALSSDAFLEHIRKHFTNSYALIVDGRFNECLQGK